MARELRVLEGQLVPPDQEGRAPPCAGPQRPQEAWAITGLAAKHQGCEATWGQLSPLVV